MKKENIRNVLFVILTVCIGVGVPSFYFINLLGEQSWQTIECWNERDLDWLWNCFEACGYPNKPCTFQCWDEWILKNETTQVCCECLESSCEEETINIYHEVRCVVGSDWFEYVEKFDLNGTTDTGLKETYRKKCIDMGIGAMVYGTERTKLSCTECRNSVTKEKMEF